jgi:hypothetical protein
VYLERTRVGATNWSTVKRAGVVWAYSGRTGRTCMRDGFATMYGRPDATDYANLRALYRRP